MARVVVTVGMALALLAGRGRAQAPSGTPDSRARELSQAIVAADGDRARLSKLNGMEFAIADQIEKALDLTDSAKKDRIAGVVHDRFQALEDDLIEVRISAMAQTYTIEELEGVLAFGRSPTGQALRGAAPELNRELMSAFTGQGAPAADGPPLSEQKVALIKRILKGRDVEDSAHKGWRLINAVAAKAFAEFVKNTAPPEASANQAAEDAYVKRVVAAETQFYAKTFSDDQLTQMATYFDGPVGQALLERAPELMPAGASAIPKIFERQFERMDREGCEAVECSASQRAALDTRLGQIRSMMAAVIDAMAH